VPFRTQVIELRRDGECRDRRELQPLRSRRGARFHEPRPRGRDHGDGERDQPGPALPVGAPQQEGGGECQHGAVQDRARGTGRHRQPQHRPDAEQDHQGFEPELGAEGPLAGREQERRRRGERGGREQVLQGRERGEPGGRGAGQAGDQRECEPAPADPARAREVLQAGAAPGDGGRTHGRHARHRERGKPLRQGQDGGQRRADGRQQHAQQHKPCRRLVEPRRQCLAQPVYGWLGPVHRADGGLLCRGRDANPVTLQDRQA
jgi:hypothetical protein